MESIKSWGFLLLFVSAGSLIYCFLVPDGNISKTVKTVVSLVVLSTVCLPVTGIVRALKKDDFIFESAPEIKEYNEYFEDQYVMTVEKIISDTIKKYTNVPYKTDIIIDKTDDGSINIGYVEIVFSAKPEKEKDLREALFNALSIMPDIRVEY